MADNSDAFLARAAQAALDASTTSLPNVRERALRSEQAWRKMAEQAQKVEARRERVAARIDEANGLNEESGLADG